MSSALYQVSDIVRAARELGQVFELPPSVRCMGCGLKMQPTDTTSVRFDPRFDVFFFYCDPCANLREGRINTQGNPT